MIDVSLATALQSKRMSCHERHKQFSTLKMEMIESHNICTKISQAGNVWKNKSGYRANIAKVMRAKRSRNNRSPGMPRSPPYASEYPAQFKHSAIHGVSEREKQHVDTVERNKNAIAQYIKIIYALEK